MSDDLTQKLPGDKDPTDAQADDKISMLISVVQSLSANVQSLRPAFQELEIRLSEVEKTVAQRSLETKPIWERALAEIAGTRVELAEVISELRETRAEVAEIRVELRETRAEVAEIRVELRETRAEVAEIRVELRETRAELRDEMKEGFRKLGSKMEVLNDDLLTLRGNQRLLDRRVEELESKTP